MVQPADISIEGFDLRHLLLIEQLPKFFKIRIHIGMKMDRDSIVFQAIKHLMFYHFNRLRKFAHNISMSIKALASKTIKHGCPLVKGSAVAAKRPTGPAWLI